MLGSELSAGIFPGCLFQTGEKWYLYPDGFALYDFGEKMIALTLLYLKGN